MYPAYNTVTKSDSLAHCLLRLPHLKMTLLGVARGHFRVTSLWLCFLAMIVGEEYAVTEALGCFFHLCPRGWFLLKPNRFQFLRFVMKVRSYGYKLFSMPLFIVFLHFSSFCFILVVLLHVLNCDHLNTFILIKWKLFNCGCPTPYFFLPRRQPCHWRACLKYVRLVYITFQKLGVSIFNFLEEINTFIW